MSILMRMVLCLADQAHWKRMGDAFSGDSAGLSANEILGLSAVVLGLLLLVGTLKLIAQFADSKRTYQRPTWLFHQLCGAHRLNRRDRRALKNLAEHLELNQPALLFVKPEYFSSVDRFPDLEAEAGLLFDLRSRLFAR